MIFDEVRPAGDAPLRVSARVRVISTEEGGKRQPFTARYRPNHNFGSSQNRHFFIGQVEISPLPQRSKRKGVSSGHRKLHAAFRTYFLNVLPIKEFTEQLKRTDD